MQESESAKETALFLPVSIFLNDSLSALEAITKFLREERNLRYSEIADVLNRDERTIWCTYANSKKKMQERLAAAATAAASAGAAAPSDPIQIPVSAISSRELSVLETLAFYLKDEMNLSFNRIAAALRRDYRTIWTVYRRAKIKRMKNAA